jgi:hypothetical protein
LLPNVKTSKYNLFAFGTSYSGKWQHFSNVTSCSSTSTHFKLGLFSNVLYHARSKKHRINKIVSTHGICIFYLTKQLLLLSALMESVVVYLESKQEAHTHM